MDENVGKQYGELYAAKDGISVFTAVEELCQTAIDAMPVNSSLADVLNKAVENLHGSFGFVKP